MTRIPFYTDESFAALRRDHERLRYEVNSLQVMLRAFRCDLTDGRGGNAVATTTIIIPKRVGTTAGGPVSCQRKKINSSGVFSDDGPPVDVWSWIKSDSSDPTNEDDSLLWIYIEQDSHGIWWFTGQDCPAGGTTEE
jgi:hypothetical protein